MSIRDGLDGSIKREEAANPPAHLQKILDEQRDSFPIGKTHDGSVSAKSLMAHLDSIHAQIRNAHPDVQAMLRDAYKDDPNFADILKMVTGPTKPSALPNDEG
jgi:hypothetical protein